MAQAFDSRIRFRFVAVVIASVGNNYASPHESTGDGPFVCFEVRKISGIVFCALAVEQNGPNTVPCLEGL